MIADEIVSMKRMARMLVPYSFPQVPLAEELDVMILKTRTITIDGREVLTIFNRSEYPDTVVESLQVASCHFPFLPFNVVARLGKAFLGTRQLYYTDFFEKKKKYYCWFVRTQNGERIPPEGDFEIKRYEDLEYWLLDAKYFNL